MHSPDIILKARGIFKRYGGAIALDGIDFNLHRNAVNVLIGENGAGKSTLMRILAGVESADAGSIELDDVPIHLRSPRDAAAYGIAIVHQELSILPNLNLSENIFAGRELTHGGIIDRPQQDVRTTVALTRLHKRIAARTPAAQLSLGERQIVELARAITHGARILILDEPTSALSVAEAETLFEVITEIKQAGVSVVYISHRLHELLHLGDHFTVLRSGKVVGDAPRHEVNRQWIVERMSGRAEAGSRAQLTRVPAEAVLTVSGLSLDPSTQGQAAQSVLHDLSFTLHRGEIVGVYGLLGAGRTELLEVLAGFRSTASGTLRTAKLSSLPQTVSQAIAAGIVLVPEDRQRDGLMPEMSIRENMIISGGSQPILSRGKEMQLVQKYIAELGIAASNVELPVSTLSGGNQQKVLLARCLLRSPTVLLLDEPTRGVDVGAKNELYRILQQLAAQGLTILFTSSEIEETRRLADRVLVLCQGRIAAEFSRENTTDEGLFAAASPSTPGSLLSSPQQNAAGSLA